MDEKGDLTSFKKGLLSSFKNVRWFNETSKTRYELGCYRMWLWNRFRNLWIN